ncbi:hypothetical protein J6590_015217 [Homalodisca vitripennis]|nr:hypothetical protein J6590_015217 [Homalodisca vitripennis]
MPYTTTTRQLEDVELDIPRPPEPKTAAREGCACALIYWVDRNTIARVYQDRPRFGLSDCSVGWPREVWGSRSSTRVDGGRSPIVPAPLHRFFVLLSFFNLPSSVVVQTRVTQRTRKKMLGD